MKKNGHTSHIYLDRLYGNKDMTETTADQTTQAKTAPHLDAVLVDIVATYENRDTSVREQIEFYPLYRNHNPRQTAWRSWPVLIEEHMLDPAVLSCILTASTVDGRKLWQTQFTRFADSIEGCIHGTT